MTRRTAIALCWVGLLSVPELAAEKSQEPGCCVKKTGEKAGKLRCSLTEKGIEECCCVKTEEGKLHCTLADKDVETCCCSDAKAESKDAK
ncbi:MAG TPA: hypothetical protein VGC53_18255 [Vicinamibacteria bacterium]|jgi:hypothetical protein